MTSFTGTTSLNLAGITKFKHEWKNEIAPGGKSTYSKMTPSCKWSIADLDVNALI